MFKNIFHNIKTFGIYRKRRNKIKMITNSDTQGKVPAFFFLLFFVFVVLEDMMYGLLFTNPLQIYFCWTFSSTDRIFYHGIILFL